jgi:hypothetical protein
VSDLREQLQGIYERRGKLTPSLVVDEARDVDHPLHGRFEWDDAVAGENWRREQAHELIQSVRVTYRDSGGERRQVRQFHAVRREQETVYEPLEVIAGDEMSKQILLREMERDWQTLRKRYQHVREFVEMIRREGVVR